MSNRLRCREQNGRPLQRQHGASQGDLDGAETQPQLATIAKQDRVMKDLLAALLDEIEFITFELQDGRPASWRYWMVFDNRLSDQFVADRYHVPWRKVRLQNESELIGIAAHALDQRIVQ